MYSLLKNSTLSFHKFHLLLENVDEEAIKNLHNGLKEFKSIYEIEIVNFEHLETAFSLHSNKMTNLKLIMLDNFNDDRMLYLDVDLVVDLDIAELWNVELGNNAVAAVKYTKNVNQMDAAFLKKNLNKDNTDYLNAGVLLINVPKFKEKVNFATYGRFLSDKTVTNNDETLLNLLLFDNILFISNKFNCLIHKKTKLNKKESNKIYHYIGMPKPWHWGFSLISGNALKFNDYNTTIFPNQNFLQDFKVLRKFWKSYIRLLLKF